MRSTWWPVNNCTHSYRLLFKLHHRAIYIVNGNQYTPRCRNSSVLCVSHMILLLCCTLCGALVILVFAMWFRQAAKKRRRAHAEGLALISHPARSRSGVKDVKFFFRPRHRNIEQACVLFKSDGTAVSAWKCSFLKPYYEY